MSQSRQTACVLSDESEVTLALLFQTLQPLSKPDRIAHIALGVRATSNEESHYWFAKVLKGERSQALRAIRVVLGD